MTRICYKKIGATVLTFMVLMSGMTVGAVERVDLPPASNQPSTELVEVILEEQARDTISTNLPSEAGAAVYAQAMLDAYIKLDPTTAVEQGYITAQEWGENYKAQFDVLRDELPYISEDATNTLINACMNMVSKLNYMAGATRKISEDSYEVTILYEKMVVKEDMIMDKVAESIAEWEATLPVSISDISEEDAILVSITIMSNVMNLYCNAPVYEEPATTTIIVTYKDGKYHIDDESYDEVSELVFDFFE